MNEWKRSAEKKMINEVIMQDLLAGNGGQGGGWRRENKRGGRNMDMNRIRERTEGKEREDEETKQLREEEMEGEN